MRTIRLIALFPTAVFLLSGCGGGSGTAPVPPPSGLTYTSSAAVYTQGTAIAPDSPTSTGGAVAGYSVSPALPAGLALSPNAGVISGTPTAVSAAEPRYGGL